MTSVCRIISGGEKHHSRNRVPCFVTTSSCCLHADRLQKSGEKFESGISTNILCLNIVAFLLPVHALKAYGRVYKEICICSTGGMILTGKTREKTFSSSSLFTTNFTWTGLGLNPGLHIEGW